MIVFVAPAGGEFGIRDFLRSDGARVANRIRVMTYHEMFGGSPLPVGAWVFAGLDQLTPTELRLVVRCRARIHTIAPSLACLNDPLRWKDRFGLLEAAFAAGENPFRAMRATQIAASYRYPVFVRSSLEHTGSLTPLLRRRSAVIREIGRAVASGHRLRDLLVVEYSDTAVDGVFTKYSAVRLGDLILPRAMTRSQDWVTKYGGLNQARQAGDLDLEYVQANPHAAWLDRIFDLAGVDYGRIDYAVHRGRPLVWEINTNPTIGANLARERSSAQEAPLALGQGDDAAFLAERGNRLFYRTFIEAIERLDSATVSDLEERGLQGRTIDLGVTGAERAALAREREHLARVLAHRTVAARAAAPFRAAYRRLRRRFSD